MVASTLESIKQELADKGIRYVVDATSKCLSSAMELAMSHHRDAYDATLVTSRPAIHAYDRIHPERIVCVYASHAPRSYRVVVNNREAIATIAPPSDVCSDGCTICFNRKKQKEYVMCSACFTTLCKACAAKLAAPDLPDGTSYMCPSCRNWNLSGDAFGTPSSVPPSSNGRRQRCDDELSLSRLIKSLCKLDGETVVSVAVDGLVCELVLSMTRLSGTTRYSKSSVLRSAEFDDLLTDLFHRVAMYGDVRLYVRRLTFAIHPETRLPVKELTCFRATSRKTLFEDDVAVVPAELVSANVHLQRVKFNALLP